MVSWYLREALKLTRRRSGLSPLWLKTASIYDVQRLAGRIAALIQFISRLGEKAITLYQMIKKTDNFVLSDVANEAFEALKKQLAEPPVLAAPIEKEPLLLYVAANNQLSV